MRLVQLIPDVPNNVAIDVEAVATGGVATSRNDFTATKFKESKDFIELAKGTYDLKVKYTGTTNLVINNPISITVVDGKIYTLVLHGLASKLNSDALYAKMTPVPNN